MVRVNVKEKRSAMRTEEVIQNVRNYVRPVSTIWPKVTTIRKAGSGIAGSGEYFRKLRAAEMEAWEMTGGDYVRSAVFAEAG
jgi:hypothetical protein